MGTLPRPFIYILSVAVFASQKQSWVAGGVRTGLPSLKYFLSGPLQKLSADRGVGGCTWACSHKHRRKRGWSQAAARSSANFPGPPPAHPPTLPQLGLSSPAPGASAHTGPEKLSDWPKGVSTWIKGRFERGIQAPWRPVPLLPAVLGHVPSY